MTNRTIYKFAPLCILLCLFVNNSNAQELIAYPSEGYSDFFSKYIPTPNVLFDSTETVQIQVNHQSFLGTFSDIKRITGRLNTKISAQHNIGFQINTQQEGKFIATNRLALNYTFLQKVNSSTDIVAATNIGYVELRFKDQNNLGGGNDFGLNTSISLGINSKHFAFYSSINQLPLASLDPIQTKIDFPTYYKTKGIATIKIREVWSIDLLTEYHIFNQIDNNISIGAKTVWKNKVSLGLSVFNNNDFLSQIGITVPTSNNTNVVALINYNSTNFVFSERIQNKIIEIGIKLSIKNQ